MKTKNLLFTAMASIAFITGAYTQNVTIPDANLKAALVNNSSINNNMDTEIQVSEASVFNGAINVSQLNITDLTGIEAFVLLDSLDCSLNKIAGLDVSANIALTYLNCSGNIDSWQDPYIPNPFEIDNVFVYYINSLDVSTNTSLTTLKCNNNGLLNLNTSGLTSLTYLDCSDNQRVALEINSFNVVTISILTFDFLSNVALIYLDCGRNELPSLDVSGNTLLNYLDCSWNKLPSLDVSGNTLLTTLNCGWNSLTSLDVSANTELTNLDCRSNSVIGFSPEGWPAGMPSLENLNVSANLALTTLNCGWNSLTSLNVSANTALTDLSCQYNQISTLDVSGNTALFMLECHNNQLTSLDVKNGNNINMFNFYAVGNPNLSCIEVDNAAWSASNWSNYIDPTTSFSENCSAVGLLDNNQSTAILAYPNPTTGSIYLSAHVNIALSDLSGKLLLEEKNTNQLDISGFPAGMYFLHFGENNQQTFKVIKE
jgi:hypothetical protein